MANGAGDHRIAYYIMYEYYYKKEVYCINV